MTTVPPLVRRRFAIVAAVTAAFMAAIVAGGCGVPIESGPRALPSSELPPALAAVPLVAPPATIPGVHGHNFIYVPVYFLRANNTELFQVPTAIKEPFTLEEVIRALEAGPSPKQYGEGYSTAAPADANFRVIGHPSNGTLPVALDSTYYGLSAQQAILELAQVVYTLCGAPGELKRVQFYRNGAKAGVLAGNDEYIPGPVSRKDYASLFTATD